MADSNNSNDSTGSNNSTANRNQSQFEKNLSEKEAAEIIGVSPSTLIRLRKDGEIQCFRIGSGTIKPRICYSFEKHIKPFLAKCEQ